MTRVMFLPLNYGDIQQDGVYDAFREAGCELEVFDYMSIYLHRKNVKTVRNALIDKVRSKRPDLLHMQLQHTTVIDGKTIHTIKNEFPNTIISNWTGDVRNYVPPTYRRVAQYSDFNFISSTGQLSMFRANIPNRPVYYWQIGYNPKLYYPAANPPKTFSCDAVFVAHHNTKEKYPGASTRLQVCKLLRNKLGQRFVLYGGHWPRDIKSAGSINQRDLISKYHNSMCCISVSHYNDLNHYFSDRLLMCLASGRPVISLKFPGWESYFTDDCDILMVDDIREIPGKVEYLKKNPDVANFIGQQGAAKVFAEHTYSSRVRELLRMVGLK
jgi:spore maturation protein CgeB